MNIVTELAECALQCETLREFHREFLRIGARAVGAESGFILTQRGDGIASAEAVGLDERIFASRLVVESAQYTQQEVAHCLSSGTVGLDQVFPASRRGQLAFFCEYLTPAKMDRGVFRLWLDPHSAHFFSFGAARRANLTRFTNRGIPLLDQMFPVLAIAEKLHAASLATDGEVLSREITLVYGLTQSEHQVIALVLRGLTNPEIACALGIATTTARNHLASCFLKLGVASRTEALFVLNQTKAENRRIAPEHAYSVYSRILKVPRALLTRK